MAESNSNYLKGLLIFLFIVALLGVILYLSAPWLLSLFIASDSPEDTGSPAGIKQEITKGLNNIERYGVSRQEAAEAIKKVESKQVKSFLAEAQTTELNQSGEIVDLAAQHFDLSGLNLERVKQRVNANVDVEELQVWLKKIDSDSAAVSLGTPVMKDTAVKLLEKKKTN